MTKKIELPKREIKFRIWDKDNKKMFYKGVSPDRIYMGLDGKLYNGLNGQDFSDNFILMQYTGLHDRNGKEVYEGDIVRITGEYVNPITNSSYPIHRVQMVCWESKKKVRGNLFAGFIGLNFGIAHTIKIEVIGNIFENPELLEK